MAHLGPQVGFGTKYTLPATLVSLMRSTSWWVHERGSSFTPSATAIPPMMSMSGSPLSNTSCISPRRRCRLCAWRISLWMFYYENPETWI